jgi:hypothetical protein
MKVYVSARAETRLNEVKQIHEKVKALGHEIISDWTAADIKKPYRHPNHRKHNLSAQTKMLERAAEADIFIMLDEAGLRGAYVEFGAFLSSCLKKLDGRKAFIVGPDSHERQFIFESPDFVHYVDRIEEVFPHL